MGIIGPAKGTYCDSVHTRFVAGFQSSSSVAVSSAASAGIKALITHCSTASLAVRRQNMLMPLFRIGLAAVKRSRARRISSAASAMHLTLEMEMSYSF